MKTIKIIFISTLVASITFQGTFGQEKEVDKFKFGFGTTLFQFSDGYLYEDNIKPIYFVFDVNNKWRFEPSVGLVFSFENGFEEYS